MSFVPAESSRPMPLLSLHSDLFWATLWPCASFGLTALVFAALLVWLWGAPAPAPPPCPLLRSSPCKRGPFGPARGTLLPAK